VAQLKDVQSALCLDLVASQIQQDFRKWQLFESCNTVTQTVNNVNDFCRPTPPLFLNL
jgi:hypothetical protein